MSYKPVIGLEVHVELKTKSKMFCECSSNYFGEKPNTHVCPVCLGLPGALPYPNRKAIDWCVMLGLSLNCKIRNFSKFDRKNYFYPDLPKGYQISQYDQPFCENGTITIETKSHVKQIEITRVHMEEDTGKLLHSFADGEKVTLIDFNRSGVPLVEIVTEPDFEYADEVVEYLKKLQQIVRYLGISDADMEKGEMRLEPNISLRKEDGKLADYKVEVKNINSFRFVEKAINYELKRQSDIINSGQVPTQETRGFDEKRHVTVTQRQKEEANDYRYFPEPDIPPLRFDDRYVKEIASKLPELPDIKTARFEKLYSLLYYDAKILTRSIESADYFEETLKVGGKYEITPKQIANFLINKKVDIKKVLPAECIQEMIKLKPATVDLEKVKNIVLQVLKENKEAVNDFSSGKENALQFLVGQVMKKFKARIETEVIKKTLLEYIK